MSALDGAKRKLQRAKYFADEVSKSVIDYLGRSPFVGVPATLANGDVELRFEIREDIPPLMTLLLGDCIHNLRATLDHVACQLVHKHAGGDFPTHAYFPMPDKKDGYRKTAKEKLRGAETAAVDLIESFEPWTGGKYKLRLIHVLDIADKHQRLLLAGASNSKMVHRPNFTDLGFPEFAGMGFSIAPADTGFPLKTGDLLAHFAKSTKEQSGKTDIDITVCFGVVSEEIGYPVTYVHELCTNVSDVIQQVEERFFK